MFDVSEFTSISLKYHHQPTTNAMVRSSRSLKGKNSLPNKENVPPPGVDGPKKLKPKKRSNSSVLATLGPRTKKVKATKTTPVGIASATTFLGLHYDVLDHLLKYLDVKSLEALGQTCSQMDLLINGRYLTSVKLPFSKDDAFMKEIKEAEVIEKKPVLKVVHHRPSLYRHYVEKKSLLDIHLSLLSLKKVREVDLGHATVPLWMIPRWMEPHHLEIDRLILQRINLGNISRLSIMFSDIAQAQHLEQIMPAMSNLLELKLVAAVSQ